MPAPKQTLITLALAAVLILLFFSIRLFKLSRSLSSYKHYWNEKTAAPMQEGSLLYVALGDSTAQGIGASKPEKGYVGLIAKQLSAQTGRPVHVINLSVSGAGTEQLTNDQLPKLKKINLPDDAIVTLSVGANDLANFNADQFLAQTETLFSQLPLRTLVADIPYFGGGREKGREANVIKASAIIDRVARKYNLRVAPLHQTTKDEDSLLAYGADFFHPSNKGYQNWHKAFESLLKQ